MDYIKLAGALVLLIPVCMLFTWPTWLIGLFRGRSMKPRFKASWAVAGRVRRYAFWYIPGVLGMMLAGFGLSHPSMSKLGIMLTLIAIPMFALSQYCAFWHAYLIGDKRYRKVAAESAARVAAEHKAWEDRREAALVEAEPDWV
ncbi:hypothetical protein GCM10025867_48670 (plasmid) [Frondihabitans sucicola]|uniref:Uncharacterized protein n=1 Tax=Frondihabitans sucicola TaxID=1268041 RepID=A0ABM8GVY1_9MICO|nr:hypothetical protein [Frondihabitans sucicola]BDZ52626.1 hypothetical protein GCM10025867_48670 [Frondihabitans sucicola]